MKKLFSTIFLLNSGEFSLTFLKVIDYLLIYATIFLAVYCGQIQFEVLYIYCIYHGRLKTGKMIYGRAGFTRCSRALGTVRFSQKKVILLQILAKSSFLGEK